MTTLHKIKWLARFFDVSVNYYLRWEIRTREEDGGAYDLQRHKSLTSLEDAVEVAWKDRKMDAKLHGVLAYRELNYRGISDEELGITPADYAHDKSLSSEI